MGWFRPAGDLATVFLQLTLEDSSATKAESQLFPSNPLSMDEYIQLNNFCKKI